MFLDGTYLLKKPCHLAPCVVCLLPITPVLVFLVVMPGVPRLVPADAVARTRNTGLDLNRELPGSRLGSGMNDCSAANSGPALTGKYVSVLVLGNDKAKDPYGLAPCA